MLHTMQMLVETKVSQNVKCNILKSHDGITFTHCSHNTLRILGTYFYKLYKTHTGSISQVYFSTKNLNICYHGFS